MSPPIRIRRGRVAVLLVLLAALAIVLGDEIVASPSPTTAAPATAPGHQRHVPRGALGEAGGAIPDGTTVFDQATPGVIKLDPALLGALRRAATDATADGVRFVVDSGWRSPAYQEHLLQDAVAQYGSQAEAARWVATPETSAHVSGGAVDVGADAAAWLSQHGARYGLCQVYANESWHFELQPDAVDSGCPPVYADPTHDPRMQS
jgi:LAS superfamily LD-carboxypeptidase LdcB